MIITVLAISGLAFTAFLALVIGIRRTERHHSLCNPHGDGLAGAFARRVLGVYVGQAEDSDHNHGNHYGQVRR